uniref:toll/interleukin-1 receptor domain-containing protein n=1 Tax=Methanobrevibacter sp. TaxID=66852 RepID=UPI00388F10F5
SDKNAADAICHVLEENKFKCWIKPRDVGIGHIAEEITAAIKASKSMVLVFSEHAKASNYVNTEVDMAFSNNVPIIVFKIDNSRLDGGLEFFLENKHWLDAYPNPSQEFKQLVIDVSKLLDMPIKDPVVSDDVLGSVASLGPVATVENMVVPSVKNESKENRGMYFLKIFSAMCILPTVLSFIGAMSSSPNGQVSDFGTILILIALGLFILTPLYVIGKYLIERFG